MDKKPRLIDADALIEILKRMPFGYAESFAGKAAIAEVSECPTIEAEPVRHGRWVVDDLGRTHCSGCGERLPFMHCYSDDPCCDYDEEWDEEWDEEIPESRYCPNCGAKMDGGAEAR